ncbi:TSUP family transporter [Kiloniella sp. EL199]|uniref:TSUP family transporter n=1 Tax=Kiloniella sp. EL199 TaxID=2107581 RepID=UPI0013C467FE|nr:TSUP family transporter [Kiloniella sp. EL199]
MSQELLPLVGLILFISSLIQGAVGFAFGLIALTFLTLLGIELSVIVPLLLSASITQLVVGVCKLRKHIKYPPLIKGSLIRYVTLPLGILSLGYITAAIGKAQIEQLVGFLILLIVGLQIVVRPVPRNKLHCFWTFLAFSASGYFAGLIAVGGPPIVLWVMTHKWTNQQIRSFLFASFLASAPINFITLYYVLGDEVFASMFYGFAFSPLIALGSHLGVKLGHAFSPEKLRAIAFSILVISSLSSIAAPLLH